MTRLYLLIGGLAGIPIVIATVWFLGGQAATDRAERDAMQSTINNAEKFNEGASNPDDCHWIDRLRGDCPD